MSEVYRKGPVELRLGDWREVLAAVAPDAVITDPPYGARTHAGHDRGVNGTKTGSAPLDASRRTLSYSSWSRDDVERFVDAWAERTRGWVAAMSCDSLAPVYRAALEERDRVGFAPIPCCIPGMTVRLMGDGPSSWSVSLNVARPRGRAWSSWGTLPGFYLATRGSGHIGGKPLDLMRAIVRDYSRPGELVCDPCAGGGTTLIAAALEGRRAIGAELDPATFEKARARIERTALTPPLPGLGEPPRRATQSALFDEADE